VPLRASLFAVPTLMVRSRVAFSAPSLTLSVMTAVPLCLATAVIVSVRLASLPPITIPLFGTSMAFDALETLAAAHER